MSIQICLVSDQAAANLLPALDPDLRPAEVVLLVTGKMLDRGTALQKVLQEAGVSSRAVPLSDEHDLERLKNEILSLIDQLDESEEISLNLTGGTKLMALAAQSIGEQAGWGMFYVDADTDELVWLSEPARRQPLKQQLRLRHYLAGYGFTSGSKAASLPVMDDVQPLLMTLVRQLGSMTKPIGQLNWLAQQAEDKRRTQIQMIGGQLDDPAFEALLRNFDEAGLLRVENNTLIFKDDRARDFVKGGWLEHHVFRTVASLADELAIRDKAANLEVVDDRGVKNELDIAFLAGNRLHVIECKTARMDRGRDSKANDTLFKLSEIGRRVGGSASRAMLVSYRPLGKSELQLARALRVETVSAAGVIELSSRIRSWVLPER